MGMERVGFQNFVEDKAGSQEKLSSLLLALGKVLSSIRHRGLLPT